MQSFMAEYAARLQEVFGESLLTLVLYGSSARGAYQKGVSDINVLVILEQSSPRKIFMAGLATRRLARKHRITPFIMTREEFLGAADVFPLEYMDIQDRFTVLYGDAGLFKIDIRRGNLRHQLEEKLRGAVGDIRAMLLAAGGNEKLLAKMLRAWSGAGGVLFRGLMYLKGRRAIHQEPEALLELVAAEYDVPAAKMKSFLTLNAFRSSGGRVDSIALAEALLETLKELARLVDAMEGEAQ